MILSNGLSLTADVLFSASQLDPTCFDNIFFFLHGALELVVVVLVVVVEDSFSAYGLVSFLIYIQNTAVAHWLYLVLKCLQLGNVKNVEGGGSDLAGSAMAS